jgi:uncharacterized membrane protein YfcA
MDWTSTDLLFVAVIGAVVGFLSGLFGVGGGFLLVPLLNTFLGIPMPIAVGSAACYTLGPATTAMLTRRPSSGFIELPLILAGGLLAGVFTGTWSIDHLESAAPQNLFGRPVPAVDASVLSCYALLMSGIAIMSFWDAATSSPSTSRQRVGLLTRWLLPPVAVIPDLKPGRYSIPLLAWTGFFVGLLSGFLGMSGGLILVPASMYLLGMRVHHAATITTVIVWLASMQASVMHAINHNVDLLLVSCLLIGGTTGARLGAEVGMNLAGRKLKFGFGLLVLIAAIIVISKLTLLWHHAEPTG